MLTKTQSADRKKYNYESSKSEKIAFLGSEFIDSLGTNWFGFDTRNLSSFTEEELDALYEINQAEVKAKKILRNLASDLAKNLLSSQMQGFSLQKQLDSLKLSGVQKQFITIAFDQMIAQIEKNISEQLKIQLKNQGKKLYNAILCEHIIVFLESILEFKNKIDKNFPGLSDQIIALAVPAITSLATTYAPAIGAVLKFTNILGRGAEFLKTENLQESIKTMKADLAEIQKDKQLAKAQENGNELAEISELLGVSPEVISKFNLNPEDTKKVFTEIQKNEDAKKLLQNICEFAKDVLPNNQEDIDKKLIAIKTNILEKLTKVGTSKDNIEKISEILDESISKAKSEMTKTLSSENRIFDKIASVQQSTNIINETYYEIKRTLNEASPDNKQLADKASRIIKDASKVHLAGNIEQIASAISKDTNRSVVKALGASHASKIVLNNTIKDQGKGI